MPLLLTAFWLGRPFRFFLRAFGFAAARCPDLSLIIARHILGAFPRQDAGEPGVIGKVVTAVMELHAFAVTRQGDISGMTVQARRRQHMHPVHRDALGFVDGGGIAVIEMGIVLEVERHGPAGVQPHGHILGGDGLHHAQRAVLDPQPPVILEEHDAVAGGEGTLSALDTDSHIQAQFLPVSQLAAREAVERCNLVIGMGEDDAGFVRRHSPIPVPAIDQTLARLIPGLRRPDHAVFAVGFQRLAGPAGGKLPGRFLLPALPLAADIPDLDMGMTLHQGPESRAGLDGLKLLGVSDQNHLGAMPLGFAQDPLHLAGADHAGFVDYQHVLVA